MRFRMLMGVILTVIGIGLLAMHNGQTAGDLCRSTGRGLVAVARYVDGPEEVIAAGSQLLAKGGQSIKDGCTQS